MSSCTLTAIRAKHGDALLLTHGDVRVLIDGGASGVYARSLRPFLAGLAPPEADPPRLDLLMVSHIDSDHIAGVLDLVDELAEADEESRRPLVALREVWHNSFSDLIADERTADEATAHAASVSLAGVAAADPRLAPFGVDATEVLASVGQGRRLRQDLGRLAVDVNDGFADGLVLRDARVAPWARGGLALEVVGPTSTELLRLRDRWKRHLPALLDKARDRKAHAAAAAALDRSVFNLSSLVVVASVGGRRVLLTGDARGDAILDWLPGTATGGVEHFDIVKLPHHGSVRNVTPDFFARVTADEYLLSGNGLHGNPEPDTLEMLFRARPAIDYRVHLTYTVEEMAERTAFDAAGWRRVMDEDPRRQACLRFPGHDEPAITVELPLD